MTDQTVWVSEKQQPAEAVIADAECDDPVYCFDENLHFVLVNKAGCEHLGKSADQLIDHGMLDVFPQMTSSKNHRNLLRALGGTSIADDFIESSFGPLFQCTYTPLIKNSKVSGVLLKARRISK